MKLKKKHNTGLVTDEITYKNYYPELSKTVSYGQFRGDFVIESSTHCIGSQMIKDPKGNEWEVSHYVNVDLSKYMYKGEPVFVERQSGALFMCSNVRISDELYVTCIFKCISFTKMPPKSMNDNMNHIITFDLDNIPTDALKEEVLEALKPCDTDVTVISIIKKSLRDMLKERFE